MGRKLFWSCSKKRRAEYKRRYVEHKVRKSKEDVQSNVNGAIDTDIV